MTWRMMYLMGLDEISSSIMDVFAESGVLMILQNIDFVLTVILE